MGRPRPAKTDLADIDEASLDEEELDSRVLYLVGEVEEASVKRVIRGIFRLNELDGETPIRLVISTYGGSVDEAYALYDAMRMSIAPVHTVGLGKVMSAGCLLLAAGAKGSRMMGRNARLMYHAGYIAQSGDVFEHANEGREFQRTEKQYDLLVARETGKKLKQVRALYDKKRLNKYMTAVEARKFGFVDILR
jgi:ATP-dependent Clp protease, protease subunit